MQAIELLHQLTGNKEVLIDRRLTVKEEVERVDPAIDCKA